MTPNHATAETNPPATDEAGGSAEGFAPIADHELVLGEPIPQSIWSRDGILLLPRGGVVANESQRQRLLDRGHWHDPGVAPWADEARVQVTYSEREDPFDLLAGLPDHITQIQQAALTAWESEAPATDEFTFTFERLISKVESLTRQWPDPMLAAAHRPHANLPYSTHHPLDQALVVGVVGHEQGFDAPHRRAMIGAAFLADVALYPIRDTLHEAAAPLTDAGRERLAHHPRQSRAIAAHAGVTDPLLLYLVEHHHDRSAADADLPAEQEILAFADAYTAMLHPRGDRAGRDACTCFRVSLAQDGHPPERVRAIVATLGFYPPGSSVELTDGRFGVVTERGETPAAGAGVIALNASGHPIGNRLPAFTEDDGPGIQSIAGAHCLPNAAVSHFYGEWARARAT